MKKYYQSFNEQRKITCLALSNAPRLSRFLFLQLRAGCRWNKGEDTLWKNMIDSIGSTAAFNKLPGGSRSGCFGPPGSGSFCHKAKIVLKNLDSYCFVTSLWLFILEKLCKCTYFQNVICRKILKKIVFCWRREGQGRNSEIQILDHEKEN